jgi:hypothetical protein
VSTEEVVARKLQSSERDTYLRIGEQQFRLAPSPRCTQPPSVTPHSSLPPPPPSRLSGRRAGAAQKRSGGAGQEVLLGRGGAESQGVCACEPALARPSSRTPLRRP